MIVENVNDKLKQNETADDENKNVESKPSTESQKTTKDNTQINNTTKKQQPSATNIAPTLPGMMSSFHSHFKFLNSRPVQDYTLKMVPPFTMQFVVVESK